jgi:hypothetical protein
MFMWSIFSACSPNQQSAETSLPKVKPVDLKDINPELFTVEEWYMPYYLKHFAAVANSVSDTGIDRGFFNLSVWRGSRNHHPYNARVMEGMLSLVWFYSSPRPWNPYYDDPSLKTRIEAALTFWWGIQNEDGRFSEYGTEQWSLAPTAFATKFIGRALWLLNRGPKIDDEVFERSRLALRKAIYIGLTNEEFWEHGRNYTNQYANLWGGALMYLDSWPDPEIETVLRKRFIQSMDEFQSPAGFFYEKGGPDWGYNLNTHHSDLQVAWQYSKGKEFHDGIIEKTKKWYDWFSYNAVKEPDNPCYYLNRSIETRQRKGFYLKNEVEDPAYARWVPQAEFIPMAHAFELSQQELARSQKEKYDAMKESYPDVAPLQVGEFNAFSPYAFLHDGMEMWLPSDKQKLEAINQLPYLKKEDFIHIRKDDRSETSYAYVRRPDYYAIFNSGKMLTRQQRYGLGLVWNPSMGTVIQSQSGSDEADYGTRAEGDEKTYEASDVFAQIKVNGQIWEPAIGKNDLMGSDFEISYELGKLGKKVISFGEDRLSVKIEHTGKFFETLPILKSSHDSLRWDKNQIMLQNANGAMLIKFKNSSAVNTSLIETVLFDKVCYGFRIRAEEKLEYEIGFNPH